MGARRTHADAMLASARLTPARRAHTLSPFRGGVVFVAVIVDFGYQAQNPDELTLAVGHKVKVTEIIDEGWWVGEDVTAGGVRGLELGLQVRHVRVGIAEPLGLAEPDAVDDRRVVQGVTDDRVLLAQEALEDGAIRVKAG